MDYSSNYENHTNEILTNETRTSEFQTIEGKNKRKKRGATVMTKLTKARNSSNKLSIEFNVIT